MRKVAGSSPVSPTKMPKEKPQDTYAQLQKLTSVDFEAMVKNRYDHLSPTNKLLSLYLEQIFAKPTVLADKICQYINDGKMEKTPGFVDSIKHMLRIGNLNKAGLVKIIETIKNKYKIE